MAKGPDVLGLLRKVGRDLASPRPLPRILRAICRSLVKSIGGTACSVMLLEERGRELAFMEAFGLSRSELQTIRFKLGEGIAGSVAKSGKSIIVADVRRERRFKVFPDQATHIRSILCVPMVTRAKPLGTISLTSPRPRAFDRAHITLTEFLARQVALEIENYRLFELSVTDPLTKLYNRRYFERRLQEELSLAERFKTELSVCMADLDNFREINEKHGHPGGDRALAHVARIIRVDLRKYDVAARLGGDEFAFLLTRATRENAMHTADRVRERIARTGCGPIRVTISVGLASFPHHARTPERMIEAADEALYHAKRAGRNRVVASGDSAGA